MDCMSAFCAHVAPTVARHSGGILRNLLGPRDCCRRIDLADTRDEATEERLADLDDPFGMFK